MQTTVVLLLLGGLLQCLLLAQVGALEMLSRAPLVTIQYAPFSVKSWLTGHTVACAAIDDVVVARRARKSAHRFVTLQYAQWQQIDNHIVCKLGARTVARICNIASDARALFGSRDPLRHRSVRSMAMIEHNSELCA